MSRHAVVRALKVIWGLLIALLVMAMVGASAAQTDEAGQFLLRVGLGGAGLLAIVVLGLSLYASLLADRGPPDEMPGKDK